MRTSLLRSPCVWVKVSYWNITDPLCSAVVCYVLLLFP